MLLRDLGAGATWGCCFLASGLSFVPYAACNGSQPSALFMCTTGSSSTRCTISKLSASLSGGCQRAVQFLSLVILWLPLNK